jgi:hypothetical protein
LKSPLTDIQRIKESFENFPKFKDWNKLVYDEPVGYGSPVEIVWLGEYFGYVDHGYLTCLPDVQGDWDEVGVVHTTQIDGDEMEGNSWNSLYELCSMDLVKYIKIGPLP